MKHFIKASAILVALVMTIGLSAQDVDKIMTIADLKAEKSKLAEEITNLEGQIADIEKKIYAYPGWKFGGTGIMGLSFGGYDNWFQNDDANSTQNSFKIGLSGYANLDREKFFWRNSGEWNAGRSETTTEKIDANGNRLPDDEATAENDQFILKSLYGYKLSDKWAVSAQGIYTTAILNNGFNNPGNVIAGAGLTWTPIPNLVAVIHPLSYNFYFNKDNEIYEYESSSGANISVDYVGTLAKRFGWKSQLISFLSYKSNDPNLSWWNWTNTVTFKVINNFGVSANFGLRGNQQETFDYEVSTLKNDINPADTPSEIQTFYTIGISYTL